MLGFPLVLREEVYFHFVMERGLGRDHREHLQLMPEEIREEMTEVFDRERQRHESLLEDARITSASQTLRLSLDLGYGSTTIFCTDGFTSIEYWDDANTSSPKY
jgi:hypothetical protein